MQTSDESIQLNHDVLLFAEEDGFARPIATLFNEFALQILTEAGELEAPTAGVASRKSMQVSGVDWDEEREVLTCITSSFAGENELGLSQESFLELLTRLTEFVLAAADGLGAEMVASDPARDVALCINEFFGHARSIRLVIVANRDFTGKIPSLDSIRSVPATANVWDATALQGLSTGTNRESLDVTLSDFGARGIEALGPFGSDEAYQAYFVVFDGDLLADIYATFGPRLLELNVRSFLQVRNKVNRGIESTLAKEPEKFLAYNNGLSLTASEVERSLVDGHMLITRITDMQIVNGGQTTASLFHAKYKQKIDLGAVKVQAKITVLGDESRTELAPKISLYANSQNPIRMADFSANDPFHVELQRLSRETVIPRSGAEIAESKWFYERARGQYADMLSGSANASHLARVKAEYPLKQKFMKTDIAKYELLWDQRPNLVALGGERYFGQFMQILRERPTQVLPDSVYYRHLIAKAILWKSTDAEVARLNLGGYKAQTVAYTVSLISRRTAQRIDLDSIWDQQAAPGAWSESVREVAPLVHGMLLSTAGSRNVSEWAKKLECWSAMDNIQWEAPTGLISKTVTRDGRAKSAPTATASSLPASVEEIESRSAVVDFGAEAWFALSSWAKSTDNLAAWQRGIAFSLGRLISQGKSPSEKQSLRGFEILAESQRLGFRAP